MAKDKLEEVQCEIFGTPFIVDVPGDQLVELGHPENKIPFSFMLDKGTHYEVAYSPAIKNIPPLFDETPAGSEIIQIPRLTDLAPEQMAKFYKCDVKEIHGKADTEIIFNTPEIKQRLTQPYAIYFIGDDKYRVDVENLELIALKSDKKPAPMLNFLDLSYDREKNLMVGYYDRFLQKFSKEHPNPSSTDEPRHINRIEIPILNNMDPIGVAISLGIEPFALLRNTPMYQNMQAKLMPLAKNAKIGTTIKRVSKNRKKGI